jgi:cysteine synthase B
MAKAEFLNPSGSVKDRAAKAMILEGLRSGALGEEKTILDATSGNTGISLAMIGASISRKVTLHIPSNANRERKALIAAYGGQIVETDPLESADGAFYSAQAAYQADPERYFFPNQYNNPANPRAHYETTGPEIWHQTEAKVTHFICSVGTGGTFVGVSRRLKEFNPKIKTIVVQPDSPFHGIEGTKHLASTLKGTIIDQSFMEEEEKVSTEEAQAMAVRLSKEAGLLTGLSSGANVTAALKVAAKLPKEALVVTILGDSGTRYLSDNLWRSI